MNDPVELHAGNVSASEQKYIVTNPHGHKTLKEGDKVVMIVTTNGSHYLIRLPDMTTHDIWDEYKQYVHLIKLL